MVEDKPPIVDMAQELLELFEGETEKAAAKQTQRYSFSVPKLVPDADLDAVESGKTGSISEMCPIPVQLQAKGGKRKATQKLGDEESSRKLVQRRQNAKPNDPEVTASSSKKGTPIMTRSRGSASKSNDQK